MNSYPINPQLIENYLKTMLGIALADKINLDLYRKYRASVVRAIESMESFASLRPGDPAEYCRGQAARWQTLMQEADQLLVDSGLEPS